ncbi:MAG: pyridoxamine 5'-phosphate oxidase family protein, partial [Mailhella sp.]|nr:pyridoxamine 5'-phosphate oxidase family protein [Mailhella sp.]
LMGTGLAELVDDMAEKQAALAALSSKYESKCTLPVPEKMLAATSVIRITILSMSGKKNDKPAA